MLQVITDVQVEAGRGLRLRFADGLTGLVPLDTLTAPGGLLAQLADPGLFAKVAIGYGGRALVWPGEVELCADALWLRVSAGRQGAAA